MDGVGHRLIVSTGWLAEIEKLIEDGFKENQHPDFQFQSNKGFRHHQICFRQISLEID